MLKITDLKKSFGRKEVLQGVSLTAEPGELIHISGINGSGKSTIFKIITGLLKADSGEVISGNEDIVGALIENPGFLEYESAMTNLRFLGDLKHRFDEEKTKDLLQHFDLDPDDTQAIAKYSVGMRQKVGIIQAVMEDQNIILLDEPTRGIDQESIKQFAVLLNNLKRENKTVIVASHDQIDEINYDQRLQLINGTLSDE
ncbi:ATP-binding cassette domain-containing protein [Lactobacillus xylocopicola]|uniref:Multidrug ABC transporter ATP-binding protein n=1 Tax=Lactobacillus xylocopicola TaxID=2976676 RepID=A0ABN6SKS8_9LACO|nr:ABC transporter ATP-binding protein [Lactobacillus xylocopicola]BDR60039.1 multidrug ABC transporter ATP-binding protein [Lactobacillus xylocopicola]